MNNITLNRQNDVYEIEELEKVNRKITNKSKVNTNKNNSNSNVNMNQNNNYSQDKKKYISDDNSSKLKINQVINVINEPEVNYQNKNTKQNKHIQQESDYDLNKHNKIEQLDKKKINNANQSNNNQSRNQILDESQFSKQKDVNTNNTNNTNIINNTKAINNSKQKTKSTSPTPSQNTYTGNDLSPGRNQNQNVYSKREKSELFLFRGIPNSTHIEMLLGKEKIYHFVKPTNPLLNIDLQSKVITKNNYTIEYTKNSILKNKLQQSNNDNTNTNNYANNNDNIEESVIFNSTISKIPSTISVIDRSHFNINNTLKAVDKTERNNKVERSKNKNLNNTHVLNNTNTNTSAYNYNIEEQHNTSNNKLILKTY